MRGGNLTFGGIFQINSACDAYSFTTIINGVFKDVI